ncbi:MAG TPA: acetamidase/formamidase family protein [Gaiellaceae bacterium]|nr:acetamidase/formamidase family protein [Gaiellaceae bacterium]
MAVHDFEPTVFHATLGSYEPALRIEPGDTVRTTTVDAGGRDAAGEQRIEAGNAQTGPFYVVGAEPGDTLAVDLIRITPNRATAFSATSVAANVVDPDYVPMLPASRAERVRGEWRIDAGAGTATLVSPETSLGALELPLAPMLGCFGVAPAGGEAISTATSGRHGGNMDYRGFTAGVTALFPVFVPGALFSLGDGHALQGDGEIVGTGLEISMDVEFSVSLRKGMRSWWPRGETPDAIFTVGNARPLDQAVQHATTEMLRWLQADFGLDPVGASTLLGQCVEYDLGNVFDPAYTMVCKLARGHVPASSPQ